MWGRNSNLVHSFGLFPPILSFLTGASKKKTFYLELHHGLLRKQEKDKFKSTRVTHVYSRVIVHTYFYTILAHSSLCYTTCSNIYSLLFRSYLNIDRMGHKVKRVKHYFRSLSAYTSFFFFLISSLPFAASLYDYFLRNCLSVIPSSPSSYFSFPLSLSLEAQTETNARTSSKNQTSIEDFVSQQNNSRQEEDEKEANDNKTRFAVKKWLSSSLISLQQLLSHQSKDIDIHLQSLQKIQAIFSLLLFVKHQRSVYQSNEYHKAEEVIDSLHKEEVESFDVRTLPVFIPFSSNKSWCIERYSASSCNNRQEN